MQRPNLNAVVDPRPRTRERTQERPDPTLPELPVRPLSERSERVCAGHPNRTEISLPSLSSSPDLICCTPEHPLWPTGAQNTYLKKSSQTALLHLLTLLLK